VVQVGKTCPPPPASHIGLKNYPTAGSCGGGGGGLTVYTAGNDISKTTQNFYGRTTVTGEVGEHRWYVPRHATYDYRPSQEVDVTPALLKAILAEVAAGKATENLDGSCDILDRTLHAIMAFKQDRPLHGGTMKGSVDFPGPGGLVAFKDRKWYKALGDISITGLPFAFGKTMWKVGVFLSFWLGMGVRDIGLSLLAGVHRGLLQIANRPVRWRPGHFLQSRPHQEGLRRVKC
jgi:hypothetical protein